MSRSMGYNGHHREMVDDPTTNTKEPTSLPDPSSQQGSLCRKRTSYSKATAPHTSQTYQNKDYHIQHKYVMPHTRMYQNSRSHFQHLALLQSLVSSFIAKRYHDNLFKIGKKINVWLRAFFHVEHYSKLIKKLHKRLWACSVCHHF